MVVREPIRVMWSEAIPGQGRSLRQRGQLRAPRGADIGVSVFRKRMRVYLGQQSTGPEVGEVGAFEEQSSVWLHWHNVSAWVR